MKRAKPLLVCATAILLASLLCLPFSGGAQLDKLFQANEAIDTIVVKLDVGADGDDLAEPIALDLGLGFPLWLHSIGRDPAEMEPFGAVSQQVTAEEKVKAGTSATFTFSVKGENHHDLFRTTPQLLAGVRVSDISRVGFASTGKTGWILAGYEIRINDKLFASSKVEDEEAQTKAKARLAKIDEGLAPLVKDLTELEALIKTKVATPEDEKKAGELAKRVRELRTEKNLMQIRYKLSPRAKDALDLAKARLDEVEATLLFPLDDKGQPLPLEQVDTAGLEAQKTLLRGMLAGTSPWFLDADFNSPWRKGAADTPIKQMRVTIETAAHTAADTKNYVYFSVGGHKYLVASPSRPLSWEEGPQVFDLDLRAGPLVKSDLRVWGLGMLGHPNKQGKGPDRWHPQRLLVEVDGKVVYDSDDVERDRLSLAAIRLIPPVHYDEDGTTLVINEASARELFYWEAGQGFGLDKEGEPVPLPDPPQPEPVVPPVDPTEPVDPTNPFPEPPLPPPDPDPWGGAGADPWGGGGPWGGGPWGDGGGGGGGGGGNGGSGGTNGTGQPFQIQAVLITAGWKMDDPFKIEWTITGDDSPVDHYDVSLRVCRPDSATDLYSTYLFRNQNVSRNLRSYIGTIDATIPVTGAYYFVAPMVVAIPKPGQTIPLTSSHKFGPARAIFPANTNPSQWLQPVKWIAVSSTGVLFQGGYGGAPTAAGVRGAWIQQDVKSNTGIPFMNPHPGQHAGLRPLPGDKAFGAQFVVNNFTGTQLVLAHLGFMEGTMGAGSSLDVSLFCKLTNNAGQTYSYPKVDRNNLTSFNPMYVIDRAVNVADVGGAGPYKLEVELRCTNGTYDPALPVGIFGLRVIPVGAVIAPDPTVTDLAITEASLCPGAPRPPPPPGYSPIPYVKIRNNGPLDIPADIMNLVQVRTRYYTGEYGDGKGDANPADLITLTNSVVWTGPFKVGDVVTVNPSGPPSPALSFNGTVFTGWRKLLCSEAEILFPPQISDTQPNNNTYSWEPSPPVVVGSNQVGKYEVILYTQTNFNGTPFVVECKPGLRHKVQDAVPVTHMGQVKSFKVGSNVKVTFFQDFSFNTMSSGTYATALADGTLWANARNSLIVFPNAQDRPGGLWLHGVGKNRFFPLHEIQAQLSKEYPDAGLLDNKATWVTGWRGAENVQGAFFDNPGLVPPLLGLHPPAGDPMMTNPTYLFPLAPLGWANKISSLRVQVSP